MQNKITVELPWIECPTCGNNKIGDLDVREEYNKLIKDENLEPDEAFQKLGISGTCCRASFWNVPVIATCRGRELLPEALGVSMRKNNVTGLSGSLFSINSSFGSSAGRPVNNRQLPSKAVIGELKLRERK